MIIKKTITVFVALVFTCAPAFAQSNRVKVVSATIQPYTRPDGKHIQVLYVTLKNVGKTPVTEVDGSVHFFDKRGKPLAGLGGLNSDISSMIFFGGDGLTIKPGGVYRAPKGDPASEQHALARRIENLIVRDRKAGTI